MIHVHPGPISGAGEGSELLGGEGLLLLDGTCEAVLAFELPLLTMEFTFAGSAFGGDDDSAAAAAAAGVGVWVWVVVLALFVSLLLFAGFSLDSPVGISVMVFRVGDGERRSSLFGPALDEVTLVPNDTNEFVLLVFMFSPSRLLSLRSLRRDLLDMSQWPRHHIDHPQSTTRENN